MRSHNGMRPHDIVVLLKIISLNKGGIGKKELTNKILPERVFLFRGG